jgi:hypothetical protein
MMVMVLMRTKRLLRRVHNLNNHCFQSSHKTLKNSEPIDLVQSHFVTTSLNFLVPRSSIGVERYREKKLKQVVTFSFSDRFYLTYQTILEDKL